MPNFNRVILAGHLTRDPELKYTQANLALCKGGLAVSHKHKDKETVCFVDFTIFGKAAETFNQYMRKGAPVLIEGRLQFEQWESEGGKRSKHSVIVDNFTFLGGKGGGQRGPAEAEPQRTSAPVDDEDAPF